MFLKHVLWSHQTKTEEFSYNHCGDIWKKKKKRIVLWDRFAAIITPQDRGHRDEKLKGTTKKLKKHQHNA